MGVSYRVLPKNGCCEGEIPLKMDDWGVPLFFGNLQRDLGPGILESVNF